MHQRSDVTPPWLAELIQQHVELPQGMSLTDFLLHLTVPKKQSLCRELIALKLATSVCFTHAGVLHTVKGDSTAS